MDISNLKHKILACFYACCVSLKSFKQELAKLSFKQPLAKSCWRDGVVVRASALQSVDLGFIP